MHSHNTYVLIGGQVHFQVIGAETLEADTTDDISGETEIEKVWTRNIESRSKNLIPVFDSLHTSRYQQTRYVLSLHLCLVVYLSDWY